MHEITALTYVGNFGQTVTGFEVTCDQKTAAALKPEDFTVENGFKHFPGGSAVTSGVTSVEITGTGAILNVDEFLFAPSFKVVSDTLSFAKEELTAVKTAVADEFEAKEHDGVLYRLYSPSCKGKRPLILFLHGGGEIGNDNWKQLTACIGACTLAERFPTCYVMAPQSPIPVTKANPLPASNAPQTPMGRLEMGNNRPFHFPDAFTHVNHGHDQLANCEYIIRQMIAEGKVDPSRVYVTGMSMGGAGALRAIGVSKDLYAACVAVCPFIDDEIYYNLAHTDVPTWVQLPYVDHVFERNMYVAHAVIEAKKAGKDARLTIFSREELEAYGIGADPGTPIISKISQNHAAWILTYNNEYGILDWMMNQVKK